MRNRAILSAMAGVLALLVAVVGGMTVAMSAGASGSDAVAVSERVQRTCAEDEAQAQAVVKATKKVVKKRAAALKKA